MGDVGCTVGVDDKQCPEIASLTVAYVYTYTCCRTSRWLSRQAERCVVVRRSEGMCCVNCEEPPPPPPTTKWGPDLVRLNARQADNCVNTIPFLRLALDTATGPGTTVSREQLTESPAARLTHFLPAVTSHRVAQTAR